MNDQPTHPPCLFSWREHGCLAAGTLVCSQHGDVASFSIGPEERLGQFAMRIAEAREEHLRQIAERTTNEHE